MREPFKYGYEETIDMNDDLRSFIGATPALLSQYSATPSLIPSEEGHIELIFAYWPMAS